MEQKLVVGKQGAAHQIRARTRGSWTPQKEDRFLLVLSQTCNVTLAAKEVGMSPRSAYARRAKDAGFRNAWSVAISEAYATLEQVMLERAISGDRKPVYYQGQEIGSVTDYPDRLAMVLFAHHSKHQSTSPSFMSPDEVEERRAKLAKRLQLIRYQAEAAKDRESLGSQRNQPVVDTPDGRVGGQVTDRKADRDG